MSPSKSAFEKYKPRGLFLEFYGMLIDEGTGCGKTYVRLSGTGRNKLFSSDM